MITIADRKQFRAQTIAQDDDEDHSESGWAAVLLGDDEAALAAYAHCSCYDTWEALADAGAAPAWDWTGTLDELVDLARRKADPDMPGRTSTPEDRDHDHLMAVYEQILAWDANGRPRPAVS